MAKFISAGHCFDRLSKNYDPGAIGSNSRIEAHEAIKMRDAVTARLIQMGDRDVIKDLDSESLSQYLKRIQTGTGSVVCEFHFNAFNGNATGTEVLVQQDADKMDLSCAKALADSGAKLMNIHNRGVKKESESKRGRLGLMRESGIVVLVEICFIDNAADMKAYDQQFNSLALAYAKILHEYDRLVK